MLSLQTKQKASKLLWPFLLLLLTASCSSQYLSVSQRIQQINALAQQHHFKQQLLETNTFTLFSLQTIASNSTNKTQTLDIYIEGDGFAWVNSHQPSQNPTPINPVAFHLAASTNNGAVAYLARPCQFVNSAGCNKSDWTHKRFSKKVISASNQAIDLLKKQSGLSRIRLFGYSGGGAVAALLASQRNDVDLLVTIAGNIDHIYWARHHGYALLSGSLNPPNYAEDLQAIKQVHFVGANDSNIVPGVSKSYISYFKNRENISMITVSGADHSCCWAALWPQLLEQISRL